MRPEQIERWAFRAIGLGIFLWIGEFLIGAWVPVLAGMFAFSAVALIMAGAVSLGILWTSAPSATPS